MDSAGDVCSGHGMCDGAGTLSGTGTCACDRGWADDADRGVVTSVRLAMDQLESAILLCVHKVVESMATAPVQTYALVTQVGRVWRVTRRRVRILHPRDFPTAQVMESARRPTCARAKTDIKEEDARSARQLVVQQRAAATIQSSATHAASIHRCTRTSAQIQGINARDVTVGSVMVKVRKVAAQIVTAKKNQLS